MDEIKTGQSAPTAVSLDARRPNGQRLGVVMLSGIVVASMIGGGAFNLPANMARGAGLLAIVAAWIITLIGMTFLSGSFRLLAERRPDLKAGIYSYAQAGFGPFAGFQMAWGYWLSAAFGNVAFAVLVVQIFRYFFPGIGSEQEWPSMLLASSLIWGMCAIVLSGIKLTALLSVLASVLNIGAIGFAIAVMAFFLLRGSGAVDVWGPQPELGSLFAQVKSTMLVALWVFIGIEAAVVVSDRAKRMTDVGPATFIGLGISTLLYLLLSTLPFGIMSRVTIAGLANPSVAYVLAAMVGTWGAVFVNLSLLLSVLSSWLAWTVLAAELPFEGAKDGTFPRFLAAENRAHVPAASLLASTVLMQLMLFLVLFVHDAWLWLISITGVMILPPYLASTLFLALPSSTPQDSNPQRRWVAPITGVLGSIYALWLLYAAGLEFVLMSTILFAVGVPVFWFSRHTRFPNAAVLSSREKLAASLLFGVAAISTILLWQGR